MAVHISKVQRLAWATDIHLNFISVDGVLEFCERVRRGAYDALVITGDIAEGESVRGYLRTLAARLDLPVYFVLGNHDFYDARIKDVRAAVTELAWITPNLRYLPAAGVVSLTDRTALVGCDGWGDLRHGKGFGSRVEMQDHYLIRDLAALSPQERFAFLRALGAEEGRESACPSAAGPRRISARHLSDARAAVPRGVLASG